VKMWFEEVLPRKTKELLEKLSGSGVVKGFYLSGGTGLALRIGHRESEDLDFFKRGEFEPRLIEQELRKLGRLEEVVVERGT